ncbi:MAG: PAS domain S-box protein [Rhodoblastus sp.]|nr:MAG: PAS domain S-box protein [Rhodoblastus sp.]
MWWRGAYVPVRSRSGKVLRYFSIVADVTATQRENEDNKYKLAALSRVQAVIEFTAEGVILDANENFLSVMGYRLEDIKGRHHRIFVEPNVAESAYYKDFWSRLRAGEFVAAQFRRIGEGGRVVWIEASYNPVLDSRGRLVKVVKFATDITRAKTEALDNKGKMDAISRAQGVVELSTDGVIVAVNEKIEELLGWSAQDLRGKHHRMTVDPADASAPAYAAMWEALRRGEPVVLEQRRVGASGKQIWAQVSCNPIVGPDGAVVKIVEFVADVTGRVGAVEGVAGRLRDLAKGDLARRLETAFIPALDPMRVDFNAALDNLDKTMRQVSDAANAIRTGCSEIATATDDLERRTTQQASRLEETAAALEQTTATVRKSAESALDARGLASRAKSDAEGGALVMRDATEAMKSIEASSRRISDIIGVIDEIAFQTNLLALNAGVEAARAGDAGRGFAVVASEVRALAQRSADAAKEIKALISSSSSEIAQGVALVSRTGEALSQIVGRVVEIDRAVGEISVAAQEQSAALGEITSAVGDMDRMTQSNAAMVEETSAASRSLAGQSTHLARLMSGFALTGAEARDGRRAACFAPARGRLSAPGLRRRAHISIFVSPSIEIA